MKILHTADWHLGKSLERLSLQGEQAAFLKELLLIADQEEIDIVLVAGDIFDSYNPPAWAFQMFYTYIEKLSKGGGRPVIITSGNHDSGLRLQAVSPLAIEQGIFVVGTRETNFYDIIHENYSFKALEEGVLSFTMNDREMILLALPYLNERTIGKVVSDEILDHDLQEGFEYEMEALLKNLSKHFKEDSLNVIMGHFFIKNSLGMDEIPVKWGGAFDMSGAVFPAGTDYIAMGHMHHAQKVPIEGINAYYAGSPMAFSKKESLKKYVMIIDGTDKKTVQIDKKPLPVFAPVAIWRENSIEALLEKLERHREEKLFLYIELETTRPLEGDERKELHSGKPDIVELIINWIRPEGEDLLEKKERPSTMKEAFIAFYKSKHNGIRPSELMIEAFMTLLEKEGADETD